MTYHRTLMDDLIRISSESGSGSGSGNGPRELLRQQINQDNQTNVVRGIGTTIGSLNATDQQLMRSASKFVDETQNNATRISQLDSAIGQNVSKLNQLMDSYQAIKGEFKEGFDLRGWGSVTARAATAPTTTTTAPTTRPTNMMDAALEVSDITKESHKYALVIFGIFATYALYKTIKHLRV